MVKVGGGGSLIQSSTKVQQRGQKCFKATAWFSVGLTACLPSFSVNLGPATLLPSRQLSLSRGRGLPWSPEHSASPVTVRRVAVHHRAVEGRGAALGARSRLAPSSPSQHQTAKTAFCLPPLNFSSTWAGTQALCLLLEKGHLVNRKPKGAWKALETFTLLLEKAT